MGRKFGEEYARDMIDRGRREIAGVMFEGSNVAQPLYPLRGTYGPPKEPDAPESSPSEPAREEPSAEVFRDDPGRDDPDVDIDR